MTLNEAIAIRIRNILKERKMTQYRLEQNSGVPHNTLNTLLRGKYKSCKVHTLVLLIRGFGMTVANFFDDPIFESDELELE